MSKKVQEHKSIVKKMGRIPRFEFCALEDDCYNLLNKVN